MPKEIIIKKESADSIKNDLLNALESGPAVRKISSVISENAEVIQKLRANGYSYRAIAEIFGKELMSENHKLNLGSLTTLVFRYSSPKNKKTDIKSPRKKETHENISVEETTPEIRK